MPIEEKAQKERVVVRKERVVETKKRKSLLCGFRVGFFVKHGPRELLKRAAARKKMQKKKQKKAKKDAES